MPADSAGSTPLIACNFRPAADIYLGVNPIGGELVPDSNDAARDRFAALYDQHYPAVLRYAARRIGAEAARDVAAETFLVAWRLLDRVPSEQPLPWLYATARKCLANELRRQDTRDRLDARIRAEAGRGEPAGSEFSERLADQMVVLAALDALRPLDQEA